MYEYADELIKLLRDEINAEFHNAVNLIPRLDEIHLIQVKGVTVPLYERLLEYHRRLCEKVCKRAYKDALKLAVGMGYEKPKRKRNTATVALALLVGYSPVTEYKFSTEAHRKRDRLTEGVLSARTRQQMREIFVRNGNALYRQERQYIDLSVDEGTLVAYEDAGVEQVTWVTERDGKVCSECLERDGMIYRIDRVPAKPHVHCRCHFVPVSRDPN